MKILGKILLWIGFLSGSLAAVFEVNDATNLKLTVPWFIVSMIVVSIGIAMIWGSRIAESAADESTVGSVDVLRTSISNLVSHSAELNKIQDQLAPSEIVKNIDDRCAIDFQEFADSRKSIIPIHGLSTYADVMTQFAAGERAMNRAWSAAADGYIDEVRTCLAKSHEHLSATRDLLNALKT